MKRTEIRDEEIPYEVLQRFGLSQEMIEDLPQGVLSALRDGRRSPVLPICYTCEDGTKEHDRARFSLMRDPDTDKVQVLFYPMQSRLTLDQFSETEQAQLRSGTAIMGEKKTQDGHTVQVFYQIDGLTQQVLTVPTPVIGNNLQVLADYFGLSAAELNCLKNGEPLTITDDQKEVTFGIDLNDPKGFRYCMGDATKWREQSGQGMDTYTFGIFGCWVKDADGNLNYVPEESYTEEMWEEQKRIGQSRAAAHRM